MTTTAVKRKQSSATRSKPRQAWVLQALLAGAALIAFLATFDFQRRTLLRIQSAAEEHDWQRVLALATPLPVLPEAARLQVNRALFYTGRLTNDFLAFAQPGSMDVLASLDAGPDVSLPLCDTMLELGQVNLAERCVQELVEVRGEKPALLWRQARINLVKERPAAARVFLNLLTQVPFHRTEARRWLASLEQDPSGQSVDNIARLRAVRTRTDQVDQTFQTEVLLRQLLRANSQNQMAAEYLAAQQLLRSQATQQSRGASP